INRLHPAPVLLEPTLKTRRPLRHRFPQQTLGLLTLQLPAQWALAQVCDSIDKPVNDAVTVAPHGFRVAIQRYVHDSFFQLLERSIKSHAVLSATRGRARSVKRDRRPTRT